MIFNKTKILNNGVEIPVIGLGVYNSGEETTQAVKTAIQNGYRHIDTAKFYGNETDVGKGVRESGVDRHQIFITTKLWNDDQLAHRQREVIEQSLENLQTDYIDLFLIHWPVADVFVETWKILEEYYEKGVFRAIGVSNFQPGHIEAVLRNSDVIPAVNQIEVHPYLSQEPLVKYCHEKGIEIECWSPIARGKVFSDSLLQSLADKYQKSIAQIVLRWEVQRGLIVIPKSIHKDRMLENADIFDFELSEDDMKLIFSLNQNESISAPRV